jgi:hypothetical protein
MEQRRSTFNYTPRRRPAMYRIVRIYRDLQMLR